MQVTNGEVIRATVFYNVDHDKYGEFAVVEGTTLTGSASFEKTPAQGAVQTVWFKDIRPDVSPYADTINIAL